MRKFAGLRNISPSASSAPLSALHSLRGRWNVWFHARVRVVWPGKVPLKRSARAGYLVLWRCKLSTVWRTVWHWRACCQIFAGWWKQNAGPGLAFCDSYLGCICSAGLLKFLWIAFTKILHYWCNSFHLSRADEDCEQDFVFFFSSQWRGMVHQAGSL
jgi:hypothetical protein